MRLTIRKRSVSTVALWLASAGLFGTLSVVLTKSAQGQATPTATQDSSLSVFAAGTGTWTGLYDDVYQNNEGKNLGITAGGDLRIGRIGRYLPSVEVRGTYPFHKGTIDSVKNIMGGLKVERPYLNNRLHPYVGGLFGRGEINYQGGGYYVPSTSLIYYYTVTNVYAAMAGGDLDLTDHFAVKLDVQYVHYNTPTTSGGSMGAVPLSLGVVYKFDFNPHHRYPSGR